MFQYTDFNFSNLIFAEKLFQHIISLEIIGTMIIFKEDHCPFNSEAIQNNDEIKKKTWSLSTFKATWYDDEIGKLFLQMLTIWVCVLEGEVCIENS